MANKHPYLTTHEGKLYLTDQEKGLRTTLEIKEVLYEERSPYQHIMIVDTVLFGRALILDGIVQTTEKEGFIYNEMISHMPLAFHPKAEDVLIVGGGDLGVAREVLKYPFVRRVDMVEIDARVVEASRTYLPEVAAPPDDRLHIYFEDGALFVGRKEAAYDVIIVDAADPVGPATVLFEHPFYAALERALRADGVMAAQSDSPIHHIDVCKRTHSSLKSLFPIVYPYFSTVPAYPSGWWMFTLASKRYDMLRPLDPGISTRFVNDAILRGSLAVPNMFAQALFSV
ncbi:MAG: polyamine aminopropyltransferase [Candidatus Carbobacillus altaicus]|nr:polyamine aminopropyltransferase [Candidatus Carbobacillus altaicus]